MSEEKQQQVLNAAIDLFVRHGFRRVTMGDIATAAGLSRPALYLLFDNKEAVFTAGLRRYTQQSLQAIEGGLADDSGIRAQLERVVEIATVQPFELMQSMPEARELTDCSLGFAGEVMVAYYDQLERLVASIFEPYADALQARGLLAVTLAQVFTRALRGLKETATSVDELRGHLDGLIGMTIAALGADNLAA